MAAYSFSAPRLALMGQGLDAIVNVAPGSQIPTEADRTNRYYTALSMSGAIDHEHHSFRQAHGHEFLTGLRNWWDRMEARRGH